MNRNIFAKLLITLLFVPSMSAQIKLGVAPRIMHFLGINKSFRYNEICWPTAHNSYAATSHGYTIANQKLTTKQQFDLGIRCLMPDVWPYGGSIKLCHGDCAKVNPIQQPFKVPRDFSEDLIDVKNFLAANPEEIITLMLENYVFDKELLDNFIKKYIPENSILKPGDWNTQEKGGWPTIDWMIKNNKRLVIFNDKHASPLTFHTWQEVVENMYDVLDRAQASQLRAEAADLEEFFQRDRYLYTLNLFPAVPRSPIDIALDTINGRDLRSLINYIVANGIHKGLYKGRYPNFIAIDHVHRGELIEIVREINLKAQDSNKRTFMFAPIRWKEFERAQK